MGEKILGQFSYFEGTPLRVNRVSCKQEACPLDALVTHLERRSLTNPISSVEQVQESIQENNLPLQYTEVRKDEALILCTKNAIPLANHPENTITVFPCGVALMRKRG